LAYADAVTVLAEREEDLVGIIRRLERYVEEKDGIECGVNEDSEV